MILEAIGENPDREGLDETPDRFARWWAEFIEFDPGNIDTTFEAVRANQMVVVSGMRVVSLCEHHLLPFFSQISVGYIATDKVLGLSKFARIAHKYAHRLQIQERLVEQIAEEIQIVSGSESVAVVAQAVHLCMSMRGIKTDGVMTTSVMIGDFYDEPETREEFLRIVREGKDVSVF